MAEFKRMVSLVISGAGQAETSVTDILMEIRSRCPEWSVTPCRVRKALAALGKKRPAGESTEPCRVYPNDIVELRRGKKQTMRRMSRGQVYQVAGYDDDSSEEELPGRCSVSWMGESMNQTPALWMKESSLRLVDRPFVIGDRVSSVEDPRSLGVVVEVRCACTFTCQECKEECRPEANLNRPVGGFRAEDLVAHDESRWVGRVMEAFYRVEVEICKRCEHCRISRRHSSAMRRDFCGKCRSLGTCILQVGSEGLPGFEALELPGNSAAWRELCKHFPGQKVSLSAGIWRQAEWTHGIPKMRGSLCGTVLGVSCTMLGVRWHDGWKQNSEPPAEWVDPSSVWRLDMSNCTEGWVLGEHLQAEAVQKLSRDATCAMLTGTATTASVKWADGRVEDLPSTRLLLRQGFYSHDFLPQDFVARSVDADRLLNQGAPAETLPLPQTREDTQENTNQECSSRDLFSTFLGQVNNNEEILPVSWEGSNVSERVPIGVVKKVNLEARTAVVEWKLAHRESPQVVSLFELAAHPMVDIRLSDIVFLPPPLVTEDPGSWTGRICRLENFAAEVRLGNGKMRFVDVEVLRMADTEGYEGSQTSWDEGEEEELEDEFRENHATAEEGEPEASAEVELEPEVLEQEPEAVGGSSSSSEIPAFDTFDEDLEPADHKFVDRPSPPPKALMRAVRREMSVLRSGLSGGEGVVAPILVRTYASRSDLFRAMVVGPPGTPYADVPFFFDLALSPQYPAEPPLVHYFANYVNSSERLNPNLYRDGKVCLSLLGTWAGPGWDPEKSTLLQVLVSLQGLVLVEDPYFNEPGHQWDANTEHGRNASALYNENVRLLALRAALNTFQQPPKGFEEVVAAHFTSHGPKLLAQAEEALADTARYSEGFRQVLGRSLLPALRAAWRGSRPADAS